MNFTILTEPGKILKIFVVITDVRHFFVMSLFLVFFILCKTSIFLLLKLNDDRFLCSVLLKTFLVRKRLGRTVLCFDPSSLFGSKLFLFSCGMSLKGTILECLLFFEAVGLLAILFVEAMRFFVCLQKFSLIGSLLRLLLEPCFFSSSMLLKRFM